MPRSRQSWSGRGGEEKPMPQSRIKSQLSIPYVADYLQRCIYPKPVTVAEWSKACTVFARSEAGIVGSDSIQGMDVWCVCVRSVFVLSFV
jgi:hypothetical protein